MEEIVSNNKILVCIGQFRSILIDQKNRGEDRKGGYRAIEGVCILIWDMIVRDVGGGNGGLQDFLSDYLIKL